MALPPIQQLDAGRAVQQGQVLAENEAKLQQQAQLQALQQQLAQEASQPGFDLDSSPTFQQMAAIEPVLASRALQNFQALDDRRQKRTFMDNRKGIMLLKAGKKSEALKLIGNRIARLKAEAEKTGEKLDLSDTLEIQNDILSDNIDASIQKMSIVDDLGVASGFIKPLGGKKRVRSEFDDLLEMLPKEDRTRAARIKAGLEPRAVGSGAITTATTEGLTEKVAESKSLIKERAKFSELTGKNRAERIEKGVDSIGKINKAVGNIDKAINVLKRGAGVGAMQRFLPSFKAASVELDNIQNSMALDVIGSVTFGALSEGELRLAQETALPKGLDTPELIDYLQRRKGAQEKLRDYYNEQIQFLNRGGSIAEFINMKEQQRNTQQPTQTIQQPPQGMGGFKILSVE
jgi:hypothetical protein